MSERVATLEGRTNEQVTTITDVRAEIRLGFTGLNSRIDRLKLLITVLPLALVLLACEVSRLDEIRNVQVDSFNNSGPFRSYGISPSVLEIRAACKALAGVDYEYSGLNIELPLRTLQTASVRALRYDDNSDTLQFNCERYWLGTHNDIVSKYFNDISRSWIIASCDEWLKIPPAPPTWGAFRESLRFEHANKWPDGEKARLRKLGVTFGQANDIYYAFNKSESRIRTFCNEAIQL